MHKDLMKRKKQIVFEYFLPPKILQKARSEFIKKAQLHQKAGWIECKRMLSVAVGKERRIGKVNRIQLDGIRVIVFCERNKYKK